jgi:nitrogen regulatory protein P-II 2
MSSGTLSLKHVPDDSSGTGSWTTLKMISCFIRPEKLDAIRDRFRQIDLIGGITVSSVRGFGHQKTQIGHYMGAPYRMRYQDRVRLDLVVRKDDLDDVVMAISLLTRTGRVGDGKIFVTDVLNAQRIRTGEKGADAL